MVIGVRSHVLPLALMLVVFLHTLMLVPHHAAAHDPASLAHAEIDRHARLAVHDLGKDHHDPDGTREEQHAGHRHGHDSDNHSHEVPAPASLGHHPVAPLGDPWHANSPPEHEMVASLGIERPPRR